MRSEQLPSYSPVVDKKFAQMNGLQRATECFRYSILAFEQFISPQGYIREWLRRNALLGAFLLIPAVLVMPIIGLILWQLTGWLSMLKGIFGKLIILPLIILLALMSISLVVKILTSFIRR